MGKDNKKWSLLGRLRNVVKKVRFLMNINLSRFRLASMVSASYPSRRRIKSFNDRWSSGLIVVVSDDEHNESRNASGSSSHGDHQLQRTISFPGEDDIDKRAEMFISNFYRQLRIERQVSLELRYRRDTSFGSNSYNYSP